MVGKLKSLFFLHSLRRWHFEDLVKESGMSRERVHFFLKELQNEGFITRVKPRGKMPYYVANVEEAGFRNQKKLHGLSLLQESGLFDHLNLCGGIKTAILFGSFARGDWGTSSDVDLFLYGDDVEFDKERFEEVLGREIQVFSDGTTLDPHILPNIVSGFRIVEKESPFEVRIHV
jgi:predicted nucleotidyltransferase